MSKRTFAFIAAFIVQLIYGVTYTFANDVIDGGYIKPFGFILVRLIGATVLFWLLSFFTANEKIEKKDFPTIFLAAVFGVTVNMLTFFKGFQYTTPIHASVIMITSPIIVLLLSAVLLKEKFTALKIVGVIVGFLGAILLSVYGKSANAGDNILLGNFLVFINAVSYSLYLIIVKRLTNKYHPFSFLKYLFTFGLLLVIPFGYNELSEVNWVSFSNYTYFAVAFVVVGTTFFTYLLNPLALRTLKASTLSIFIYMQPLIAGIFAIAMGSDTINAVKLIAALLIFIGVFLVTKKQKQRT